MSFFLVKVAKGVILRNESVDIANSVSLEEDK